MKSLAIFALSIFISHFALAQSAIQYMGFVFDSNHKPIFNATVQISKNIKCDNISPTDVNGYFVIRVLGGIPIGNLLQITIRHTGYMTLTKKVALQSAVPDNFDMVKETLKNSVIPGVKEKVVGNTPDLSEIASGVLTLKFNIFDTLLKRPIVKARVVVMDQSTVSNDDGFVKLTVEGRVRDSIFVIIQDEDLGISFAEKCSTRNFPLVINVASKEKRTLLPNNDISGRDLHIPNSPAFNDEDFAINLHGMLYKVAFNASLQQVMDFEFGSANRFKIDYDKLPLAIECTDDTVRYYWRYLKDSKMLPEILKFFEENNLADLVTPDSYILYGFVDNKLTRIELRLYSNQSTFSEQLFKALTNNKGLNYNSHCQMKSLGMHCIMGTSFIDTPSTELFLCNEIGYKSCIHDWWNSN